MQILFISGFLGSGKTEFIKTLVGASKQRFVILENEFGEMNFDAGRLRNHARPDEDRPAITIEEVTEGCICCSMNLDFSLSVLAIANNFGPDVLIVEASGVALLGRLIQEVSPILYERIGLLEPITILDAENYRNNLRDYPTYMKDPIAHAGTILVSRSETWTPADFRALRAELEIPASIAIPESHYGYWRDPQFEALLRRPLKIEGKVASPIPEPPVEERLEQLSLRDIRVNDPFELVRRLETLIQGTHGPIVRAKGQVACGQDLLSFDVVGGRYSIIGGANGDDVGVVLMGRGLNRDALTALFGGESQGEHHHA